MSTLSDEEIRRLASKKYSQYQRNEYDPIGRVAAQDFLQQMGMCFLVPALAQKERYCEYDFGARDVISKKMVYFEVEVRNNLDLINFTHTDDSGIVESMGGLHMPYRKNNSKADFFLVFTQSVGGRPEAMAVYSRNDVLVSTAIVRENYSKGELFFDIGRGAISFYINDNGVWRYASGVKNGKFEPLYDKWVVLEKDAYLRQIKRWNNLVVAGLIRIMEKKKKDEEDERSGKKEQRRKEEKREENRMKKLGELIIGARRASIMA